MVSRCRHTEVFIQTELRAHRGWRWRIWWWRNLEMKNLSFLDVWCMVVAWLAWFTSRWCRTNGEANQWIKCRHLAIDDIDAADVGVANSFSSWRSCQIIKTCFFLTLFSFCFTYKSTRISNNPNRSNNIGFQKWRYCLTYSQLVTSFASAGLRTAKSRSRLGMKRRCCKFPLPDRSGQKWTFEHPTFEFVGFKLVQDLKLDGTNDTQMLWTISLSLLKISVF